MCEFECMSVEYLLGRKASYLNMFPWVYDLVLCLAGIRQLQLMLLKIALLVGVEFHINIEFVKLMEPPEEQENAGN